MLRDTLEDLLVTGVPNVDLFALGKACRLGEGFVRRAAEELEGAIQPTQHVDGRRMHLAMNDEVARAWKAVAHMGAAYAAAAIEDVRF